ncbi:hypothetical protein S245_004209, partial [Arachis hypogaea]
GFPLEDAYKLQTTKFTNPPQLVFCLPTGCWFINNLHPYIVTKGFTNYPSWCSVTIIK